MGTKKDTTVANIRNDRGNFAVDSVHIKRIIGKQNKKRITGNMIITLF